jgi:hypothetical protein
MLIEFITFLVAVTVAGFAAYWGHVRSRDFSRRRLRYTRVAEHPGIFGVASGAGTALLAAPLVALLPIVGTGTALALGVGVGTGVAFGARDGLR